MAVSSDGATLYVAALRLQRRRHLRHRRSWSTTPSSPDAADDHIGVSGGGPSGLVLDEAHDRLYVLTRFDNSISVVDTVGAAEIDHLPLHNPEPAHVVAGRPFLYDAVFTSSNGEASCASCHIFGDFDSLAWDLGNPDDMVLNNPNPFRVTDPLGTAFPDHHPMKGPMTTQSLRGMANHGPMHWRGDRTGGNDPGGDPLDETQAFLKFNVAFDGLLGRGAPDPGRRHGGVRGLHSRRHLPAEPDPRARQLADAGRGRRPASSSCTAIPPTSSSPATAATARPGRRPFFGSDGFSSFEFEPQQLKIPHLRNLYQKVGMFGMPAVPFINGGDNGYKGDQVRGFGFLHDGSTDTVFRFHTSRVFNQTNPGRLPDPQSRRLPERPGRRSAAPAGRSVHARLRQQPGADRRPAGDAQRPRRSAPSTDLQARKPDPITDRRRRVAAHDHAAGTFEQRRRIAIPALGQAATIRAATAIRRAR